MYVDVHTHLTHTKFAPDLHQVIQRAVSAGLTAIVVNGLEPESNRQILALSELFPEIKPALGIYPSQGIAHLCDNDKLSLKPFDVPAEIAFIKERAESGDIVAVGECGLDGYWHGPETFAEQEKVFLALMEIAQDHDLPIIIHSRKLEKRCIEMLDAHGQKRVDFHCYCGKTKYAVAAAEKHDKWKFSIPANIKRSESFQSMTKRLPMTSLLTETDAPYLSPQPGTRNEPANVVNTVHEMAKLREVSEPEMAQIIWNNFTDLFGEI